MIGAPITKTSSWQNALLISVVLLCGFLFTESHKLQAQESAAGDPGAVHVTEIDSQDEQIEILRRLGSKIRSNQERIKTWSASFSLTDRSFGRDVLKEFDLPEHLNPPFSVHESGRGEFAVDLKSNSLFTRFEIDSPMIINPGTFEPFSVDRIGKRTQISILKPEQYIHFRPEEKYGRFQGTPDIATDSERAAFIDPAEEGAGHEWAHVVDPREFLGWGKPFWEEFEIYATKMERGIDEQQRADYTIRKIERDEHVEYVIQYSAPTPPEGTLSFESRVDSKAGLNVTNYSCVHSRDGLRHDFSLEYQLIDEIWIPTRVSARWSADDGEHMKFQRTIAMQDVKLNEPIEPVTFSFSNLGIVDGERVLDRIDSRLSIYRDGELISPNEYSVIRMEGPRKQQHHQFLQWLMWLNLFAIIIVAAWWLWQIRPAKSS